MTLNPMSTARIRRTTALLPLLICLLSAPWLIGPGKPTALGESPRLDPSHSHTMPAAKQHDGHPVPHAGCERLIPWILFLAVCYQLHRQVFGLNPILKSMAPSSRRLEVGQLVAIVLGCGVLAAWKFEAAQRHIAAELSVATAQAAVILVAFVALWRNNKLDHPVIELFEHELCSMAVLLWIAYGSWHGCWQQADEAALVVGAAVIAHTYYAYSCLRH